MATHDSTVNTSPAGVQREVFNHQPPYSLDLAPSDFHLFFTPHKFLSDQRQHFQNDKEEEMSVMVVPIQAEDFYDTRYKSWFHGMTNVSILEVTMLKNSLTFALSVPINIFIKFGFVSLNGTRETYFVDALRRFCLDFDSFKPDEIGKWWHMIFCQMSVILFWAEYNFSRNFKLCRFMWHMDEKLLQIFWFSQFIGSSCYFFTIIDVDLRLQSFIVTCVS